MDKLKKIRIRQPIKSAYLVNFIVLMSTLVRELQCRPDISRPRWDQNTFDGRFRHFFAVTNPMNMRFSDSDARTIVHNYRYVVLVSLRSDTSNWF